MAWVLILVGFASLVVAQPQEAGLPHGNQPDTRPALDGVLQPNPASIDRTRLWLDWTPEKIAAAMPTPDDWRAFHVNQYRGCPVHGPEIYRHGSYPWRLGPPGDYRISCPIGRETYPDANHPDDGRGWTDPQQHRYWFRAYAIHWQWRTIWLAAPRHLAEAYALTGDRRYADRAIAMLRHIARHYADFDYGRQSKEGQERGTGYGGKIVNVSWEAGHLIDLAVACDLVKPALGDDLKARREIETGLLDEAIKAINAGKAADDIAARPLAYLAVVRGGSALESALADIWESDRPAPFQGINHVLYNSIFKDGAPHEVSPSYNWNWWRDLNDLTVPLGATAAKLHEHPRFTLLEAHFHRTLIGGVRPNLGDCGGITDAASLKAYLPSKRAGHARPDPGPDFLDGYGLAKLTSADQAVGVWLFYGPNATPHGHCDQLGIEIARDGKRLSPDLGYPDFTGADPGRHNWTAHTLSHNTVMVDGAPQTRNAGGRLRSFLVDHDVVFARAEAPAAYAQCSRYERMLWLNTAPSSEYLVDVFTVQGGREHVLSAHGPATIPPEGFKLPKGKNLEDWTPSSAHQYLGVAMKDDAAIGDPCRIGELRIFMPALEREDRAIAWAYASPTRKSPHYLAYVLRRTAAGDNAARFVTVWDLTRALSLESASIDGDLIRVIANGETRVFNMATPTTVVASTEITNVDYDRCEIVVKPCDVTGKCARISNERRSSLWQIQHMRRRDDGITIRLAGADPFVGRVRVAKVKGKKTLVTRTAIMHQVNKAGATLLRPGAEHRTRIESFERSGVVTLRDPADWVRVNDVLLLADFGVGDTMTMDALTPVRGSKATDKPEISSPDRRQE